MIHIRQQIRERVAELVADLTLTQDRVFTNRLYTLEKTSLPCLVISSSSDQLEGRSSFDTPAKADRNLTLKIEVYVKANEGADDALDAICADVEVAMAGDKKLNGLAIDTSHQLTNIEFTTDGDKPHGLAEMEYLVQYRIQETEPDKAA